MRYKSNSRLASEHFALYNFESCYWLRVESETHRIPMGGCANVWNFTTTLTLLLAQAEIRRRSKSNKKTMPWSCKTNYACTFCGKTWLHWFVKIAAQELSVNAALCTPTIPKNGQGGNFNGVNHIKRKIKNNKVEARICLNTKLNRLFGARRSQMINSWEEPREAGQIWNGPQVIVLACNELMNDRRGIYIRK